MADEGEEKPVEPKALTQTVTTSGLPAAGGVTSGDGTYAQGAEVTVTAAANAGFEFLLWLDGGGDQVSVSSSYTFAVGTSNAVLQANFAPTGGCGNCVYGREAPASAGIGEGQLSCCRLAPRVTTFQHLPASPPMWKWPIVRAEWWCGEHELR
jgi:hypothetical protein